MKIYNTIYKKTVDFKPLNPDLVTMYACGPTVYDYITIGNFRTFAFADLMYRMLRFNGYNVKFVMNVTDVGHLTSDADSGEDKLEVSSEKQSKSAAEIADFYFNDFLDGYEKLNLTKPNKFTRATDYIEEQIALIKRLEDKGYTYKTSDGIYFDTSKFEGYGQLSGMTPESIKEGARVEPNPEKKNPTDFALWKFSPKDKKRSQEWVSPWGIGFPGWHIECSAMAMKELDETIDIHIGGEDLKMIHHQNEIAQSEAATDKKFVKYWMHPAFLLVDDGKMSKSLGNAYTMHDVEERGFDPLSLRYFYMSAHYRSPLNFTWRALKNSENSLLKIYEIVEGYEEKENAEPSEKYMAKFIEALDNDINMPKAVSILWELLKSEIDDPVKVATLLKMDEILGFNISDHIGFEVPQKIIDMARARREYRKAGIWDKADMIRKEVSQKGYVIEDLPNGEFEVKRRF